jgi:hypothetical protein
VGRDCWFCLINWVGGKDLLRSGSFSASVGPVIYRLGTFMGLRHDFFSF